MFSLLSSSDDKVLYEGGSLVTHRLVVRVINAHRAAKVSAIVGRRLRRESLVEEVI